MTAGLQFHSVAMRGVPGVSPARHLRMSANLPTPTELTDEREWLEDVEGEEALAWVRERNAHAEEAIGTPSSKPIYNRILEIMDSNEKIPYIGRVLNGLYYNFWQDETHVRGILNSE